MLLTLFSSTVSADPPLHESQEVSDKVATLGQFIFFDPGLSRPRGVACATCHAPQVGYTHEKSGIDGLLRAGVELPLSGVRNTQSLAYNRTNAQGLFWDGRVATLVEQAMEPLFNNHEMNAGSPRELCERLISGSYAEALLKEFSLPPDCNTLSISIINVALISLAAFQESDTVNRFSSRYDSYIASGTPLKSTEIRGYYLFYGKGKCAACHSSLGITKRELFRDFSYHNIGIPDDQGPGFSDYGRFNATGNSQDAGKFKTPTLRNVTKLPFPAFGRRYGHSGTFNSLRAIVEFHNTRTIDGVRVDTPFEGTVDPRIGSLGLDAMEIDDLMAFLRALEDR